MRLNYDELARQYSQNRKIHTGVLQNLLETAQLNGQKSVLEVGCGTGNYILAIQAAAGCECHGVDPSEKMLEAAMQRGGQVHFQQAGAEKLPFADAGMDLVFNVDVIHHVIDRDAFFSEAWRVLKPGGLLCTVTDDVQLIRTRVPLTSHFPETVEVELKRYPRSEQLRSEMQNAGITPREDIIVRFPYDLTDLRPYEEKAFSSLHLISEEAWRRGLERMRQDLQHGPIKAVSHYLMLWGDKKPD